MEMIIYFVSFSGMAYLTFAIRSWVMIVWADELENGIYLDPTTGKVVKKDKLNRDKANSYMLRRNRAESRHYQYKITEVFRAENEQTKDSVEKEKKKVQMNLIPEIRKRATLDKLKPRESEVSVIEVFGQILSGQNRELPGNRIYSAPDVETLEQAGYKLSKNSQPRRSSVEHDILPLSKNKFFSPL